MFLDGFPMKLAAFTRDRDRVFCEVETGASVRSRDFQHSVAGLDRSPRLGDDHGKRLGLRFIEFGQDPVDPVGIRVVDKADDHRIIGPAEGVGDELRSQR